MEKMIADEWDDEDDRNMMIGSSCSSDGKMVIKLKIPKLPDEGVTEDEESPVIGKRVCVVCKKEFSSGKALGGHMRIHVVQSGNKNPSFLKLSKPKKLFKKTGYQNQNKKPYYMNSVNEEGEPTCSLCGKTFPSMKSLFGHMRCHPERLWRGILPPQNATITTTTAVHRRGGGGGEVVVDLMKCLPGWTVRERRGRKAVKPIVYDHDHDHDDGGEDDDDDEVLLGAVEDLLSLANGGGSMAESTNKIDENSPSVGKGKAVVMEEDEADNESSDVIYKKIKKRKKMKLMMELQQQVQEQEEEQEGVMSVSECKYKCTTCNKCFATHQALGRHRSSHNKSKLTSTDHDDESFVMMGHFGENMEKGLHHCKICNKGFATGQALGGHKRCHWAGTIEPEAQAQALSSQITSAGEAASQTGSGKKVLDFDLNEVPQVMEEEESANGYGYGYGYGYASSSYNSNMG